MTFSHFTSNRNQCVTLGERHVWKGTGAKRKCVVKKEELVYIPLLKTLQAYLSNSFFRLSRQVWHAGIKLNESVFIDVCIHVQCINSKS